MVPWEFVALATGPVLLLAMMVDLIPYLGSAGSRRTLLRLRRHVPRLLHRRRAAVPSGRPIEDIARDARRLGRQLRCAHNGRSAMRIGVIRASYDGVLGEGCDALGIAHLLGVLPPESLELDAERRRVEVFLGGAGMVLEDVY